MSKILKMAVASTLTLTIVMGMTTFAESPSSTIEGMLSARQVADVQQSFVATPEPAPVFEATNKEDLQANISKVKDDIANTTFNISSSRTILKQIQDKLDSYDDTKPTASIEIALCQRRYNEEHQNLVNLIDESERLKQQQQTYEDELDAIIKQEELALRACNGLSADFVGIDLTQSSGLSEEQFEKILPEHLKCIAGALYQCDNDGVNGLAMAGIACVESANGTSRIARDKNNIIGWTAYDRSAYASATQFDDYSDCILSAYPIIKETYLSPDGKYYEGATLAGVNTHYCTNPNWKYIVSSKMSELLRKLNN